MRRLICVFSASLFVFQDALAQDGAEVLIRGTRDFIGGLDVSRLATNLLVLIVLISVSLYAMTRLIEKAFKSNGISLWPSVSTFIAFVIVSVSGGILWGIEDVIQFDFKNAIEFIPAVAFFGFLPAIFVWVGARYRARRLRNPPEPLEESLEP